MKKKPMSISRKIILILSLLALAAAAYFLVESIRYEMPREEPLLDEAGNTLVVAAPPAELVDTEGSEDDGLPHDKLFITKERQQYARGELRLIIPRISFERDVEAGTSPEELERGPGLYDYAQLPGEGNRNVSIAGHRYKRDFYALDTVVERDYIYLVSAEHIYRYTYESSFVVEPDDWGSIYSQGFSCVTLTTCTPIGISTHRLVVRGELDAILPYSEDFVYEMSAPLRPEQLEVGDIVLKLTTDFMDFCRSLAGVN